MLADGLWYAREKYQPQVIVDVATLTGSKVRALGVEYAGLFSDSEPLVQQLTYAGQQVGKSCGVCRWIRPTAKSCIPASRI